LSMSKIVDVYETGVSSVLGHLVGILALGTNLGKMMSASADGIQISEYFVRIFGKKRLPWAMLFTRFTDEIPDFIDVRIVILLPFVVAIREKTKQYTLLIPLPLIAGLTIVYCHVPQHTGDMTPISI